MKDSYWFRHDSSAGRGLKMRKMSHKFGHEGKGLYWDVVEILRDTNEYKFERNNESLELLCDIVGFKDESRFLVWFDYCLKVGLFDFDDDYFWCAPLVSNMKNWESKKANGAKGGRGNKAKPKANTKDKIIVDKSTVDNIIKDKTTLPDPASIIPINRCKEMYLENDRIIKAVANNPKNVITVKQIPIRLNAFNKHLIESGVEMKTFVDYCTHFLRWHKKNNSGNKIRKKIAM